MATGGSHDGASLLEVSGLAGGYDDVQVLWGIDLNVSEEEIVAIVGSNGVGKSTFLRMLSGVLPASRRATITLGGESHWREWRRRASSPKGFPMCPRAAGYLPR